MVCKARLAVLLAHWQGPEIFFPEKAIFHKKKDYIILEEV